MSKPNFCVDCVHHYKGRHGRFCYNPEMTGRDPVTGSRAVMCQTIRARSEGPALTCAGHKPHLLARLKEVFA